jgi:hypothetical protein
MAIANNVLHRVSRAIIPLHGIGLGIQRARALESTRESAAFHRQCHAQMAGY